jgi:hypothetical protein
MENNTPANTWPDFVIGIFDRLSERNAEIIYELENLEIQIPSKADGVGHSSWKINGTMKLRTTSHAN